MLGTRAMGVSPAISATRHRSSMSDGVNGPCSPSKDTKSKPTRPASSTSVVDWNDRFIP